jgi:classical protein kinase C alpha type
LTGDLPFNGTSDI